MISMPSTRRKRQYTEAGLSLDNPSELQPSKRLKSSRAEFYDSLSKVWLTRRALKELDRRTSQANSPQRPASTPRRITRSTSIQIQRIARDGGPDLRDLRGYPAPADVEPIHAMASSSSSRSRHSKSTVPTSSSSKTRRSSAYDKDFEQHYIDHGVYLNNRKSKAGGLEGLHQRLSHPRPSLSPSQFSDHAFEDFQQKVEDIIDEGDVMRDVMPIIAGHTNILNKQNLQFTQLDSITGGITVDPKPDFYDGARLEDIDKSVREELGPFIIPTGHRKAPVAPNFFLEAKAPHGAADVAKRQALQNGAYGARAIHSLQSYSEGKPIYDGNAYTVTTTYHSGTGTLQMYTTHPTEGETGPEYHMTQVKAYALTSDADSFRQGATAFRNARDWAQEQRDTFITAANERARSTNPEPTCTEGMTYPGWLATLGEAQEPPTSNRDSGCYPQSSNTYEGAGHAYTAPSTFALSDFNGPVDESESSAGAEYVHTESSTFDSSTYNGPSDAYPGQESETSADELALNSYTTPATPSKRRHKGSGKHVSKAPHHRHGHSHGKSGQSRHSKR